MKRILISLFFLILFLPNFFSAEELKPVTLTIFYGNGCPHCESEMEFLDKISADYPNLTVRKLEVWYDSNNAKLLSKIAENLGIRNSGVPLTVIGKENVVGYFSDEITGQRIKGMIAQCSLESCEDFVGDYIKNSASQNVVNNNQSDIPSQYIDFFFFGKIDVSQVSLPVLTALIGILDGFNPCAMWVLLFLISLIVGSGDRKKMWSLGLAFILTGSISYYVFMAAWLNFFLFVGYIPIIRAAIGIFAVGSGTYYLWKWYQAKKSCEAISDQKRGQIMQKLELIASQKTFWLALLGIISLSLAINMIELVCSAGLPAIYTQILSLSKLSALQYYLYLLLYVFFFSLLPLVVFLVAMFTLKAFAISNKVSRWMNFFGGIIIFILGILLIFRPDLIMFG